MRDGGLVSLDWLVADADSETVGKDIRRAQENETDCKVNNKTNETNGETKTDVNSGEEGKEKREGDAKERKKIVVILPGLTGSSQSEYVKGLVLTLHQEGITCVVFNNRGIGGVRLVVRRYRIEMYDTLLHLLSTGLIVCYCSPHESSLLS